MKTPTSILGLFVSAFLLLTISLTTGCGSDDDDGEAFSPPGTVPDQLNYTISQDGNKTLTLSQNPSATVSSTLLTGTFTQSSQAFTVNVQPAAMIVSADEFLDPLDTELSADLEESVDFGSYSLHVTSTIAWIADDNPTSGELDIRDDPDPVRKITVRVNPDADGLGNPGVDIILTPASGPSQTTSVTWEVLDGLLDDGNAAAYTRIASFAYSLLRFMYEQGGLVIQVLEFLGENDLSLEQNLSILEPCDTYPPLLPPDQVVANPGDSLISWTDSSFDGELGPGDSFLVSFTECWDDGATDIDTLFHGAVNFRNYTEVQTGGVITRVGFEPTGGPGGIEYPFPGLEITETETSLTNTLVRFDETITISGGFNMVFTSP